MEKDEYCIISLCLESKEKKHRKADQMSGYQRAMRLEVVQMCRGDQVRGDGW